MRYADISFHITRCCKLYEGKVWDQNRKQCVFKNDERKLANVVKKGKLCIRDLQKNRMELLKFWFAVHIIPQLSEFDIVINIDESSFSWAAKLTHSWLTKGKAWKLNNIWYSSSTSLIATITSRGDAFASNAAGSVNGQMFLEFIVKLWKFIKKTCKIQAHKCLFMFDNAMTHRSSRVVDYWKQRNCLLLSSLPTCQN